MAYESRRAIMALRDVCHYSGVKIVATIEKGGTRRRTILTDSETKKCRKAVKKLLID